MKCKDCGEWNDNYDGEVWWEPHSHSYEGHVGKYNCEHCGIYDEKTREI